MDKSVHTKNCIFFFGMMRSGNHAVIHFILNLYSKPKAFLNDRRPHENIQLWTRRHDRASRKYSKALIRDLLLISYEDKDISAIDYSKIVTNHDEFIGTTDQQPNVICIRDPFNTFASRLKFKWTSGLFRRRPKRIVKFWKMYAQECLGITNHIPRKIVVNFNSWFSSQEYRKRLAEQLGREFNDDNWNRMTIEGKGSSWYQPDNKNWKKQIRFVEPNKLLARWEYYRDNDFFRSLFDDPELLQLSQSLFGDIPGIGEWLK